MKLTDLDEKNSRITDQLMELIEREHGGMRPFIVIFPGTEDEVAASSLTNIVSVEAVVTILTDYLDSLEGVEEMETIELAVTN